MNILSSLHLESTDCNIFIAIPLLTCFAISRQVISFLSDEGTEPAFNKVLIVSSSLDKIAKCNSVKSSLKHNYLSILF